MHRFRIEYSKEGPVAYVSHLDLNRMFERAARRAGLPVALSQGFHPHCRFSFGSVLPVGMEGEGEYLDVELEERPGKIFSSLEIQQAMAAQMPAGLRIRQVREIPLDAPGLMALINTAGYAVAVKLRPESKIAAPAEFQQALTQALGAAAWPITRTNDKRSREIDARAGLSSLALTWDHGQVRGEIWLRLSPQLAVRPVEILESLERYGGLPWEWETLKIRRTGLFITRDGRQLSPLEVATRD